MRDKAHAVPLIGMLGSEVGVLGSKVGSTGVRDWAARVRDGGLGS